MDQLPGNLGERLIRKLERLGPLADEERRMLEELPRTAVSVPPRQHLLQEDEPISHCLLLIEGLAFRYKTLENGRRQIVNFNVPGDIFGLASLLLGRVDHSICTLTLARVATIPTASVLALTELYPRVTRLLWRDTLIEAAVFREWMLSIGRRPAYERTAHLLCELISRLRAVGLADDHCCDLPITQSDLADALGLTAVHVNRMLQQLRDNGFIELHHRKLTVLDWPGLKQAAGFNPAYLYELGEAA